MLRQVLETQRYQLADAHPGRVETLQDGGIPGAARLGAIWRHEERLHLRREKVGWQPALHLRPSDSNGRVPLHDPLTAQPAVEAPDCRQLTGHGATGISLVGQPGDEGADAPMIDRFPPLAGVSVLGQEVVKLQQVF
jgi:hypothetical protein